VRKSDVLARLGGDEFVILLVNIAGDSSVTIIERLLSRLREFNESQARGYEIKMSNGVSVYNPDVHASIDDLIASADHVMYGKKKVIKESENYQREKVN
jgi:diguanylate cyclase (GGDEF)-like protein